MALTRIDSYLLDLDAIGGIDFDVQNGTPTLKVDETTHRVGVGNNAPAVKFDVRGTADAPTLTWNGSGQTIIGDTANQLSIGRANSSPFGLYLQARASNNAARDILLNPVGGDVGIGTDDPDGALNVYSTNPTRVVIEGDGQSTAAAALVIKSNDADSNYRATGVFYYDATSQTEWFSGRPYTGSDTFAIHRKTSLGGSTGNTTAHPDNSLFVINSSGNVGIGNITPAAKLEVSGDAIFTQTSASIQNDCLQIGFTAPNGFIKSKNSSGSPASNLDFYSTDTSGNTNLGIRLQYTGNVGIGTDSPDTRLHIEAPWTAAASTNDIFTVARAGDAVKFVVGYDAAETDMYLGTNTNHTLQIRTNDSPRVTITNTGNVGIGNTDPGTNLDIAGNIRLSAGDPQIQLNDGGPRLRVPIANTLTIHTGGTLGTDDYERLRITSDGQLENTATAATSSTTSNAYPALRFRNPQASYTADNFVGGITFGKASGNGNGIRAGILGRYDSTGSVVGNVGMYLSFFTSAENAGDGNEKLRIKSDGNVGIGTTDPQNKLDVWGNIFLTNQDGGLYFSDPDDKTEYFGLGMVSSNNSLKLRSYGTNSQWDDKITILRDGEIGVNTTSPTATLHVVSEETTGLRVEGNNTTNSYCFDALNSGSSSHSFRSRSGGGSTANWHFGAESGNAPYSTTAFSSNHFRFFNEETTKKDWFVWNQNGTNADWFGLDANGVFKKGYGSTTKFVIGSSGNVGINTDNASAALTVNGGAVIDGGIATGGGWRTGTTSEAIHTLAQVTARSSFEDNPFIHPFLMNDLANHIARGGSYAISGLTSVNAGVAALFSTQSFWTAANSQYSGSTFTITLTNIQHGLSYGAYAGITFGSISFAPASLKIETSTDNGANWTTRLNHGGRQSTYLTSFSSGSTATNAIRYTIGQGAVCSVRIQSLFAFNYASHGMHHYFLPRDGGQLYGNLSFPSGNGIDFASNPNASGMTSEILDDYEEGTWTGTLHSHSDPSNTTGTNTTNNFTGNYTKIGRQVTVSIQCSNLQNSVANHVLKYISGLPFTSSNSNLIHTAAIGYQRGLYWRYGTSIRTDACSALYATILANTTNMDLGGSAFSSPFSGWPTTHDSTSSMWLTVTMTYTTDS